ncbi:hypothetical protein KEM52_001433, partial [Ascosphaera acerosa]
CLLPLANVPIIEYTLEFLANAGVDEVYLYAGKHSDQVEAYIHASRWRRSSSPFKSINFIRSQSSSIGDIMRDLHAKRLIESDFVAVYGDVVSNFPLARALQEHRARRLANKDAIMTMVLREVGMTHRSRPSSTLPLFCIDPVTQRCLAYDELDADLAATAPVPPLSKQPRRVLLERELLDAHPKLDLRTDLVDTSIDICTPEVLGLWADSFDYQTPRRQFLHGVLKDYELNGKTVHTHIVRDSYYSARIQSLKAYDAISKDVIGRYTFPFVPDTNLLLPGSNYYILRRNTYIEDPVQRDPAAHIGRRCIVGAGTSIAAGARISNSVVGRRCRIESGAVLENAHVWDDCVIGEGTTVRNAIVADHGVIGMECDILPGALVGFNVQIGDQVTIPEGCRVINTPGTGPADIDLVGAEGQGVEYSPAFEVDYDDDEEGSDMESEAEADASLVQVRRMERRGSDGAVSISTLGSDSDSDDEMTTPHHPDHHHSLSVTSAGSDALSLAAEEEASSNFVADAAASMFDGIRIGQPYDMVQTELVSLRMSANASEHDTRRAVATAFVRAIDHFMHVGMTTTAGDGSYDDEETKEAAAAAASSAVAVKLSAPAAVKKVLGNYHRILERVVFDHRTPRKPDQVDFLLLMQADLIPCERGAHVLLFAVKELYDADAIEPEAIEQWWEDQRSAASEEMKKVRAQTGPFVDWLQQEDDSDESSGEESSGEE